MQHTTERKNSEKRLQLTYALSPGHAPCPCPSAPALFSSFAFRLRVYKMFFKGQRSQTKQQEKKKEEKKWWQKK